MDKTRKKLLFSDIDGTLLRSDGTISEALAAKLRRLAEAGHVLILSSGRPLNSILSVQAYLNSAVQIPFRESYIIANNGALVYDCNSQKPVFERRVPMQAVDAMQEAAHRFSIHIQTYTQDSIVCERENDEIAYYRRKIRLPLLTADKFTDVLSVPPYKMLAISLSGIQNLLALQNYVTQKHPDSLQAIFSSNRYLEIVHKEAGKGNALRFLCNHLHIPRENSFAVGDSDNDISMLLAAGCSYAMADGQKKAQSSADKITALDCEHDGLSEVIDALLQA